MKQRTRNLLLAGALLGMVASAAVGLVGATGSTAQVQAAQEATAEVDLGTFTRKNNSTGGLIYMPFDGIGVYTKTVGGAAELTLPVTLSSGAAALVVEVKNNVPTDLNMTIALQGGDDSYTPNGTYYTAERAALALQSASTTDGSLSLAQTRTSFQAFNGYAVLDLQSYSLPSETTVDAVCVSVPLSAASTYAVGSIWTLDALPADTLDLTSAQKVYTPAQNNFTCGGATENYVAQYLPEYSYYMQQSVTGDSFDACFLRLPTPVKDEETMLTDISAYRAIAVDVDFSANTQAFKWAAFLYNNKSTYNATRVWPTTMFGIGEDGEYFAYTSSAIGASADLPTVPAGFKGTIYIDLTKLLVSGAAADADVLQNVYCYFSFYNYDGNKDLVQSGSITSIRLTDTLPSVDYYTVDTSVNVQERGNVAVSPATTVIAGTSVTVTPQPNTGYIVGEILVNGEAVTPDEDGSYTIPSIDRNTEVEVTFDYDPDSERFSWTASGEHVTVTADKTEIPIGTDIVFTFAPEFSYRVVSVTVNGEPAVLEGNTLTVREVTGDLALVVTTAPVEIYETQLAMSSGTSYVDTSAPGTVYANFDSVFVSSRMSAQADATAVAETPYVGVDLGDVSVSDWSEADVIVIRYRQYHLSGGKVNGVKFLLEDSEGGMARDSSGATVYVSTAPDIADGSVLTTNAEAYISGGMVFTPSDFSGYLVLPLSCFTSPTDPDGDMTAVTGEVDLTSVAAVHAFTEYKWSTDVNARYAIGDIYIANLDAQTLQLSSLTQVWSPEGAQVTPWLHGVYPESASADDFMFVAHMQAGNIYLFDYSQYFTNTQSALRVAFSKEMLAGGEADVSALKGLRLLVDNSQNEADIPYSVSVYASVNGAQWQMSGLGKVIFCDDAGTATYCRTNTTVIPAGFKGEIFIPLDASVFVSASGDAQFPTALADFFTVSFPVVSASGLENGTHFGFDVEVVTVQSDEEYTVTGEPVDYTITYVLNEGVNAAENPASYTVEDNITFAAASREGYRFDGWYLNADFSGAPVTGLNGTCGNVTLYAKWGASYAITWDVSEGGTVYPALESAENGEEVTFALFPDDGYEIAYVTVNGAPVQLSEEDTFTVEITQDIEICVIFQAIPADPGGEDPPAKTGLTPGAIAGICVAAVVVVAAGAAIGIVIGKKKSKK